MNSVRSNRSTDREKTARSRHACQVVTVSLLLVALPTLHGHRAATPGLPFTEDFSNSDLRDLVIFGECRTPLSAHQVGSRLNYGRDRQILKHDPEPGRTSGLFQDKEVHDALEPSIE